MLLILNSFLLSKEPKGCTGGCVPAQRNYTINIIDKKKKVILFYLAFFKNKTENLAKLKMVARIIKPYKCCSGCCWLAYFNACAQEMTVEAPSEKIIGYVKQKLRQILNSDYNSLCDIKRYILFKLKRKLL